MEERIKRNKKVSMPHRLKVFLLGLVSVVFIALLVSLLMSYLAPHTEEQEITNYQYFHKGDITYEVALRDNLLYENKVLGMNKVYPANYVDQVTAHFHYEYTGDKQATLSGQYQVVATVHGIQKENQVEKILWSKDFLLEPETAFSDEVTEETGRVKLQKTLKIPFRDFNTFAQQVQQETGILSGVVLTVKYLVKTQAETEYGVVNEELTPSLRLPLGMTYFEVAGELTQEKEGALTETVMRTVPVNNTLFIAMLIGMGLCLLLLWGLLFFVKGTKTDPYQKLVKDIFKKYEERLVALEQELPTDKTKDDSNEQHMYIRVKSVDDLVRIADEISRPVYYSERGINEKKGYVFYVISGRRIFSYEMTPALQTDPSKKERRESNYKKSVKQGTEKQDIEL